MESRNVSELVQCWAVLDETIKLLRTANRIGSEKDDPEGIQYIQISDTLAQHIASEIEKVRYSEFLAIPEKDIPVFEIDPKKKYVLSFKGARLVETRERFNHDIKAWLSDDDMPFLIIDGDTVKLVKVEDIDESC